MHLKFGTTAFRPRRIGALGIGLMLCASLAEARTETLRWTQDESSRVARFEAHYGTENGNYSQIVNLGLPAVGGGGVRTASLTIPDAQSIFVALRAIGNDGTVSAFSQQQYREGIAAPPPSEPPPSEPPPSTPPPSTPPPSTGGSTTATLFDFEPGSAATNSWFDTQPNSSLAGDDSLFSVYTTGAGSVLGTASTASNIHSHVVPHLAVDANYSVQAVVSVSSNNSGIGVTAYSDYPNSDAYYRLGRLGGQTFRIEGRPDFSCSSGSADTGVAPSAGGSYVLLLRVADEGTQNRLEATAWTLGANQPAPQAVCYDNRPNRPRGGTIGVWATGAGSKYWDNVEQIQPVGALAAPVLIGITRVED